MNIWPEQRIHEVAEGITAFIQGRGGMGVSNATVVVEKKQACVVDTMTFPAMALNMLEEIKRRGALVDQVVNTHHHIDHVGGNQVFASAHIIAHPTTINIMQQIGLPSELYDRLMPDFSGRFAALKPVLPEPLPEHIRLPYNGELLIFYAAHTPADLAVWFPATQVLLAGDLAFFDVVPLAVHGLISGWIEALDKLIALRPVVVVPGHGRIGTMEDLKTVRNYLTSVQQMGRHAIAENLTLQEALALFDPGPVREWLEAERTQINLERAMSEAQGRLDRTNLAIPVHGVLPTTNRAL